MTIAYPVLSEELKSWRSGLRRVAGVDEAGRPMAAGGGRRRRADPSDRPGGGTADSKLLSARARERLAEAIRRQADVGVGMVAAGVIDTVGIAPATFQAMRLALEDLGAVPDYILVDGRPPTAVCQRLLALPHKALVGGDRRCLSIAAASIVAKVERDRLMLEYDALFPGYGFARHKGYPTAGHSLALAQLGPCAIHRRSWAPVRAVVDRLC
jgi:ribonuclease HII